MDLLTIILSVIFVASLVGWLTAKHVRSAGVVAELKDWVARAPSADTDSVDQPPRIPLMWLDPPRRFTPKFERVSLDALVHAGDSRRVEPFDPATITSQRSARSVH